MRARLAAAGLLVLSSVATGACARQPAAPPAGADLSLTPVLTVKELMEHIVDPIADWVFDAAVVDVSDKGIQETRPLTDEDWAHVEDGALILAETANLLKMPRSMVPPGDERLKASSGGPELTPTEIEAKVKADPVLWQKNADGLRTAALEALTIIRARNVDGLFDAGDKIDKACENCHLEYWYPGDKAAVLENAKKHVTYDKPKP